MHLPEPFIYSRLCLIQMFGREPVKMTVPVTAEAVRMLTLDPQHVFTRKEIYWIERGEDWYGLDHSKGKVAALVERKDYLWAVTDQLNSDPWER